MILTSSIPVSASSFNIDNVSNSKTSENPLLRGAVATDTGKTYLSMSLGIVTTYAESSSTIVNDKIKTNNYLVVKGAASTIRMYTTRERKLIKEAQQGRDTPVEKIERKWLIKLL